MKKYILALAIAALPFHAIAEDTTSNAKPWNLTGEQKRGFLLRLSTFFVRFPENVPISAAREAINWVF